MIHTRRMIVIITAALLASGFGVNENLIASDQDETPVQQECDAGACAKYSGYLISRDAYRGGGDELLEKYRNDLLCLAASIVEKQDISLVKRSVGFYHDKLAGSRSPFYIGFDVMAEYDGSLDYGRFCTRVIRENVDGIAEEVRRFNRILDDKEVAGVAVTFKWTWNSTEGMVTIWMNKDDIRLFSDNKITASELYQRSTITNTAGKVILLPI